MKIGLVCPYNIARGGGVQELISDLQAQLKDRGHVVKIITPEPRDGSAIPSQEVIYLGGATDFKSPTHTSLQVSASVDSEVISTMLKSEAFDVLHFHEPWVPVLSRQILSKSTSVNIATFHAKVPETLMSRTLARVVTPYLKSVLKYIDQFTAVSESAAEYVGSLCSEPITIIPNGVDLSRYRVSGSPHLKRSTKTILYIGRLERRKGLKYLLSAYQLLTQSADNLSLIIAGAGPDREKLEILCEDLKLPNVNFLGYISEEEKLQLLAESDVFCSPAVYGESFGIVLLEAMACGLVTVAGNNSGYTDVLQETGALSIVNPHDTAEFARRLSLLLNDAQLRRLWKDWAGGYVKRFDMPLVAEQYVALYQEALKKHHS
ncbi:MAG TPA: glycosyltransferase family 4 protein [Candidatus Dormibacteraeota bacterium]|nr:glycosyltransferase family 4 protein [Candidatus Dormibacteraeota bacterium]